MPEFGHYRYHRGTRFSSSVSNEGFNNDNIVNDRREYYKSMNRSNTLSMSNTQGLHLHSPSSSLLSPSSSSSSSSSPVSPSVPHLRHHHHSRNHGMNGSTSPFLRLTKSSSSAKNIFGSQTQASASSESVSMSKGNSTELRLGTGQLGETDTFSLNHNHNHFPSSKLSHTSSSPTATSTSTMWLTEDNKSLSNIHTNMNSTIAQNQNDGVSDAQNSQNLHQTLNSTSAAVEQFVTKSVGSGNLSGDGSGGIVRNFNRVTHANDGGTSSSFLGINNSFLSSAEEMMSGVHNEINATSLDYFENSSSLNVSIISNGSVISEASGGGGMDSAKIQLYAIIVPVMTFFCVLAVLVNLMIVISARWCRKPMSPTLYFSISLALADAYAAFFLATGLFINSFMPIVLKIRQSACISLIIEAFRQGGILVIVCHLLSLAMNHWIGIVRPLHYAATMTRRTAWTVIIFCWICPITVIFIYYSSVSGEGFQSEGCTNYEFLKERTYRAVFASCFFAPLILMSFIYIHIFIIVRNHHTHRQRYQSTQQLKRNVKAVLTTMLVLGTYIIGWMPATVFSLIACKDCMYHPDSLTMTTKYAVNISINLLVILKTLVNPVIYAARMSDIQLALKKMRYEIMQIFCKSCAPPEPPNDRGYYLNSPSARTSFYDTKSMRMSSFGSRSSSRRMTTTGNVPNSANSSLLLHTNGSQMHHLHHHNHNNIPNQPIHKHNGTAGNVGISGLAGGGTNGYVACTSTENRSHLNGPPQQQSNPNASHNHRRAFGQCSQPQVMINSKSVYEMAEMN